MIVREVGQKMGARSTLFCESHVIDLTHESHVDRCFLPSLALVRMAYV